ncbi:hypothetical protein Tco_1172233 [Tanacetum coccineum]
MADKGKKTSMEIFVPNDKADYYSRITSITVNGKNAYELKEKFLDDLHNNAFNHDKLRVVVFPISLVGGARRWFDGINESIICWVDLTAKFFGKYYLPSRIERNNTSVIKWDPANPRFEGWLATKFVNYKMMDIFTKGALWDYWKMGGDEIEVSDDESSDLEEYWSDKEETAKNFKIETDVFDYETPLCLAFNEFNYLLKVDPDLLTKDIMGEDGYCNGGNLPGAYVIGNSLHYQDLEWYEALKDSKLKNKALRNKVAYMEGLIVTWFHAICWGGEVGLCLVNVNRHRIGGLVNFMGYGISRMLVRWVGGSKLVRSGLPNKKIQDYQSSLNCEDEYVCLKEDDYNDLTITSDEACRAYQEIFRMMEEGWMVTHTE